MFKELICAVALSGTIGMTAPQNNNDGTYYQDVTITETYEYQTNEVNSVDDLIVGNIYKYEVDTSLWSTDFSIVKTNSMYKLNTEYGEVDFYHSILSRVMYSKANNRILVRDDTDLTITTLQIYDVGDTNIIHFYFIYVAQDNQALIINNIYASDFLGEKTITITPKEYNGLFSIFDNFLHERLFSGGILDTTNVTVFNATLSLGQWLSTTTSIVLLCLIVLLLVLLIKFIFKYVGGMMIWRS